MTRRFGLGIAVARRGRDRARWNRPGLQRAGQRQFRNRSLCRRWIRFRAAERRRHQHRRLDGRGGQRRLDRHLLAGPGRLDEHRHERHRSRDDQPDARDDDRQHLHRVVLPVGQPGGAASGQDTRRQRDGCGRSQLHLRRVCERSHQHELVPGEAYTFLATNASTNLSFVSTTPGEFGAANDNIVITETVPTKSDCKDGGWQAMIDTSGNHFKNQGDCVTSSRPEARTWERDPQ